MVDNASSEFAFKSELGLTDINIYFVIVNLIVNLSALDIYLETY